MHTLGWTCVGVEPNRTAAEVARRQLQLDVRLGDIFTLDDSESFDLVTFWDVLEHTPSPRKVLTQANRLLAPTGILALTLPNWDSLERVIFREGWIALDAPRHLYHFSPCTISQMLDQCGFQVETLSASAPVLSLASNVLRFAGNAVFRHGQPKALTDVIEPYSVSARPSRAKQSLIHAMNVLVWFPNACANLLNRGSSLFILARKVAQR